VIGGWIIGVTETLTGNYVDFIGSDLTILVPLAVILGVLLVRPNGLFGSPEAVRA
jgi:branched-chain amino acid transport system permease protein